MRNNYCYAVCVSISAFESLIGVSISLASSAAELKICGITIGIRNDISITEKKGQKIWQNSMRKCVKKNLVMW